MIPAADRVPNSLSVEVEFVAPIFTGTTESWYASMDSTYLHEGYRVSSSTSCDHSMYVRTSKSNCNKLTVGFALSFLDFPPFFNRGVVTYCQSLHNHPKMRFMASGIFQMFYFREAAIPTLILSTFMVIQRWTVGLRIWESLLSEGRVTFFLHLQARCPPRTFYDDSTNA